MTGYMQGGKTKRYNLDDYPTPKNVGEVVRDFIFSNREVDPVHDFFLEPFVGTGSLVRTFRESDTFRETHWTGIEKNEGYYDAASLVCEDVLIGDSLSMEWPPCHIITNPPFCDLDAVWSKCSNHRSQHWKLAAIFMPVAWWSAEKRRHYTRPDVILSLGWRPVFRDKTGPAHKGSQDFIWAVLFEEPSRETLWRRVEKP